MKMLGKMHRKNHCDCNIEEYVSGKDEKCNKSFGNKRNRAREKSMLRKNEFIDY